MDQESSGRFDISDPLGIELHMLSFLQSEGNGFAAWVAYRLCREGDRDLPEWLVAYFDQAADFLLDEYQREHARDRQIEQKLGLHKPTTNRSAAMRVPSEPEELFSAVRWFLPDLVDDIAAAHGTAAQTVIKAMTPKIGLADEQWTKLRDAYNSSRRKS